VGTLAERTTRYAMLLDLPCGHDAHLVEHTLRETTTALPGRPVATRSWTLLRNSAG
jgi:hypothetical protein